MSVTISDIARRAGVSIAMVSRVFNNSGYVSAEKRQLITDLAKEMKYSPKQYEKRSPSLTRSSTIGVVVPDIQNPYYTAIIHAIEEVTFKLGYDILFCNTDEDSNKEIRCLSVLRSKQIGGLIITPVSDAVEYNTEYLQEMNYSGIPVVLLDRDLKSGNFGGVFLNNYEGAYRATQTFIDCGHTQIAIISGTTTSKTGLERLNGYFGALRDNNIPLQEENVLYGDFKAKSAYELTNKLIKAKRNITAIFVANNAMAEGCLQALFEQKIHIPEDIALISFGVLGTFYTAGVKISHLLQPVDLIGIECVNMLLEKINSRKKHSKFVSKRISFSAELILKGSELYYTR